MHNIVGDVERRVQMERSALLENVRSPNGLSILGGNPWSKVPQLLSTRTEIYILLECLQRRHNLEDSL